MFTLLQGQYEAENWVDFRIQDQEEWECVTEPLLQNNMRCNKTLVSSSICDKMNDNK